MTPSKILFFLCLAFVGGVALELHAPEVPQIFLSAFLFTAVIIIFLSVIPGLTRNPEFLHRPWIPAFAGMTLTGFCLMFFALGILRAQIAEFDIKNDKLKSFIGKGEVVLTGAIYGEPDLRDKSQMLKIKVGDSLILISTDRYPEYNYLDQIKITGKLEEPWQEDGPGYKNYLAKDKIYSVINFAKVERLGKSGGSPSSAVYEKILFLKQKIQQSIRTNFLPPKSSIMEGTILGNNGALSEDLKNKLSVTGLRHIIAVSGTHVVILSVIIISVLIGAGLKRGYAFYFVLAFIFFYIILTGLSASGVRAGIMGGLYLTAEKLGRQSAGSRVVVLAGALMLLQNPLLLFYDAGFQLSFMAVLGLIFLEPVFSNIIKIFTKENFKEAVKIVSGTLAAQIFTFPIIMGNFGNLSWVSPVANILVLPAVPFLMVFGFLASFAGIFSNFLAYILSFPCHILLSYFLKITDIFSAPQMSASVNNFPWYLIFISYTIIFSITYYLRKKFLQNFV